MLTTIGLISSLGLFAQTTSNDSIMHDGGVRKYKLYVPAIYDGTEEVPLLLNLHGLGSNNDQQIIYGDFRPIADTANFIMVVPQGLPNPFNQDNHWNANFGTGIDDVGFLSDLIDTIAANYMINEDRVYSTGMSNGGYMSFSLAGQLSNKITAVASVTGSMTGNHIPASTVTRPVPIMQIHGDNDPTVDYNGSTNALGSSLSIDSVLNYWVGHNFCDKTPIITPLPNINTADGCTATKYEYKNGDSGAEVVHYKITDGGHTWPGAFSLPGKVTNQDFDASTEIWKFFSKYEKSSLIRTSFVSVEDFKGLNKWLEIRSENPSTETLKLASLLDTDYTISIVNFEGKQVFNQSNNLGEVTIDISNLTNGTYLVNINSEDKKAVLKIIKQ